MYVAVKGGERAIENAHRFLAEERRGDPSVPELILEQIEQQLKHSVDRVMTEGGLYDRRLAALAVKQAHGDLVEAVFLLRAYRTTLSRLGRTLPVETSRMRILRRISAAFKDVPGGQILGPTFDYTHRLLDFSLCEPRPSAERIAYLPQRAEKLPELVPHACHGWDREGLTESPGEPDSESAADISREGFDIPASRGARLQNLARADEGFLLGLAYSAQRGFGFSGHPFVGEIRYGEVAVELVPEELGFPVEIGSLEMTECFMLSRFDGSERRPPQFVQGYGLVFGCGERKAMSMALVDRALRSDELGEEVRYPAQDQEFVLRHSDNVEASGFVQHLKLPHYVDFQAELVALRALRAANESEGPLDCRERSDGEGPDDR